MKCPLEKPQEYCNDKYENYRNQVLLWEKMQLIQEKIEHLTTEMHRRFNHG